MIRMRGDAIVPILALHLLLPAAVGAQPTHFDIDLNELDRQPPPPSEKPTKKKTTKRKARTDARHGGQSDRERPARSESAAGSSPGGAVSTAEPTAPPPVSAAVPTVVPALPVSAAPATEFAWVCPVTDPDPGRIVDSFLNALSLSWCRNRLLHSERSAAVPFSIRVDRYFEYKGGRYVVSIGEGDAYSYTLIRLLEDAGYHVLKVSGKEDFRAIGEKLLILIGIVPEFGRQALPGEGALTGFLVQQEGDTGRRVVITAEPVAANRPWVLGPGCGAR